MKSMLAGPVPFGRTCAPGRRVVQDVVASAALVCARSLCGSPERCLERCLERPPRTLVPRSLSGVAKQRGGRVAQKEPRWQALRHTKPSREQSRRGQKPWVRQNLKRTCRRRAMRKLAGVARWTLLCAHGVAVEPIVGLARARELSLEVEMLRLHIYSLAHGMARAHHGRARQPSSRASANEDFGRVWETA